MAFFSSDMTPMLDTYLSETSDLMDVFDGIVTSGEQTGTFGADEVNELFRCAHTIKSSSAMMGLQSLSDLTHRLEDLFGIFRDHPERIEGCANEVIDHLYEYADFVRSELSRMDDSGYSPASTNRLLADINADIVRFGGGAALGDGHVAHGQSAEAATQAVAGEVDAFAKASVTPRDKAILRLRFVPDVAMIGARALVITRQLSKRCELVSFAPKELTGERAAGQLAEQGLVVTVDARNIEAVRTYAEANPYLLGAESIERQGGDATEPKGATEEAFGTAPVSIADASADAAENQHIHTTPKKEKFVSLRWDDIHTLQDITGEFISELSLLRTTVAKLPDENELNKRVSSLGHLVDDLNYCIESLAMLRVSSLVPQLSRMMHDMCRDSGKDIAFRVHGENIEIDRNLYNNISEPLLHIIRNSVDHGIEPTDERIAAGKPARGTIMFSVENQGNRVAFRINDDGRGMDWHEILDKAKSRNMLDKPVEDYSPQEALLLIMKAGFTTSETVTKYSGRGVGMDVVNSVVSNFGGRIELESEPGKGTSVALFMPISITSVESLGFYIGPYLCFLPLFSLDTILSNSEVAENLKSGPQGRTILYDKQEVAILDMHRLLGCEGEDVFYIVCHSMNKRFCITANELAGELSTANKPLPACLGQDWQMRCGIRNSVINSDGGIGFSLNAALLYTLCMESLKGVPDEKRREAREP